MGAEGQAKVHELKELVSNSNKIVFFGGAGVSTESGIPDFRSKDGLYSQKYKYPPEYMLSIECLRRHGSDFWDFYRDKILVDGVKPNEAHKVLAELEEQGKLLAVVTQNIDDLHELAGSKTVHHIHGSIQKHYCMQCKEEFTLDYVKGTEGVPRCECGGVIRPDITLYGETLPKDEWKNATESLMGADLLIIAGTSLTVYPANTLIDFYGGNNLVVINRDKIQREVGSSLIIQGNVGEVLGQLR